MHGLSLFFSRCRKKNHSVDSGLVFVDGVESLRALCICLSVARRCEGIFVAKKMVVVFCSATVIGSFGLGLSGARDDEIVRRELTPRGRRSSCLFRGVGKMETYL